MASFGNEGPIERIQFDEMETFEHTKCKPVTIALAVECQTRRILSVYCGPIKAKGNLAALARKKYGERKCDRQRVLFEMFRDLETICAADLHAESDSSPQSRLLAPGTLA